jgi:hypothetical protein
VVVKKKEPTQSVEHFFFYELAKRTAKKTNKDPQCMRAEDCCALPVYGVILQSSTGF